MEQLQTRLDALEQQMHTVTRRLRWWRGLAGGLLALAVLTWALPAGTAKDDPSGGGGLPALEERVAALEDLLQHFSRKGDDVFITGANLHILNGLGRTDCGTEEEPIPDCPNGLGNLIVGYNEPRDDPTFPDVRTGSHNVVVGSFNNFSRFGGLVVGRFNTSSGDFAVVSGGGGNTASGRIAVVSGGAGNTASGTFAVVSGGESNTAGIFDFAVVGGGSGNTASGTWSTVSGGRNITQETEFGWSAGSEADEVVVGNFRSP